MSGVQPQQQQEQPRQLHSSRVMICRRQDSDLNSMAGPYSPDDSPKFHNQQANRASPPRTSHHLERQQSSSRSNAASPFQQQQHMMQQQQQQHMHHQQLQQLHQLEPLPSVPSDLTSPASQRSNSNWSIASFAPGPVTMEQQLDKAAVAAVGAAGSHANLSSQSLSTASAHQQLWSMQGHAAALDAAWADEEQQEEEHYSLQQLQELQEKPPATHARKHAAKAIRRFADDLDAAGLPTFPIRDLAERYSTSLAYPDLPSDGRVAVIDPATMHAARSSSNSPTNNSNLRKLTSIKTTYSTASSGNKAAVGSAVTEAPGSASSEVPETLAALLAIVKDEWEWTNTAGAAERVAMAISDVAAQPLSPMSPASAILEVQEGAAAMQNSQTPAQPYRTASTMADSPTGQLRARYGQSGSNSRNTSPTNHTVQFNVALSTSSIGSRRISPARNAPVQNKSSSSSSSKSAVVSGSSTGSIAKPQSPSRTLAYSRYTSPPRAGSVQQTGTCSSGSRRTISPTRNAAALSSSIVRTVSPTAPSLQRASSRTGSPSRNVAAAASTVGPSRGTAAGVHASQPRLCPSRTRSGGMSGKPGSKPGGVATAYGKASAGQKVLLPQEPDMPPRVAEASVSAYERVLPRLMKGVINGSSSNSKPKSNSGSRSNEGYGSTSSGAHSRTFRSSLLGAPWRRSEVGGPMLAVFCHACFKITCTCTINKQGQIEATCSIANTSKAVISLSPPLG